MPAPDLTIVVCTLNRAGTIEGCLDSLDLQRPVGSEIEVVVVDNGSTDRTAEVVAGRPSVRYLLERRVGLSYARNAGVAAAGADLVAFLDDDARPRPGWAAALLAAAGRWPAAAALGGPVHLAWPHDPPRWLVPALHPWFSAVDHGPPARLLEGGERLVGANLAVRRSAVAAVGGFATDLGRMGERLRSGEEVDLVDRFRAAGRPIAWDPAMAVDHLIDPERMSVRWLLRRGWAQGRTDATIERLNGESGRRSLGAAVLRGWRTAARQIARSDSRRGALVVEAVRRARAVGRATSHGS